MRLAAAGICRLKCFCLCFCWTFKANPEPKIPCKNINFHSFFGGKWIFNTLVNEAEKMQYCPKSGTTTKIERMSPSRIDRQAESLNKRVNLDLGHASMYCLLRKVSLWYKIMNQWTYSWKCKEGDGKYRKAWSHNFPWPSSRNSVSITNRCHSDLKLQVAFVIMVHLCARKVLRLYARILAFKLLLTTPHHRASA